MSNRAESASSIISESLVVEDFVEIGFNGMNYYGFIVVISIDFILIWVGRDSINSATENYIINERDDMESTLTKFYLREGSNWSDDHYGSVHVPCFEGILTAFSFVLGHFEASVFSLFRREQLSASFRARCFRDIGFNHFSKTLTFH